MTTCLTSPETNPHVVVFFPLLVSDTACQACLVPSSPARTVQHLLGSCSPALFHCNLCLSCSLCSSWWDSCSSIATAGGKDVASSWGLQHEMFVCSSLLCCSLGETNMIIYPAKPSWVWDPKAAQAFYVPKPHSGSCEIQCHLDIQLLLPQGSRQDCFTIKVPDPESQLTPCTSHTSGPLRLEEETGLWITRYLNSWWLTGSPWSEILTVCQQFYHSCLWEER